MTDFSKEIAQNLTVEVVERIESGENPEDSLKNIARAHQCNIDQTRRIGELVNKVLARDALEDQNPPHVEIDQVVEHLYDDDTPPTVSDCNEAEKAVVSLGETTMSDEDCELMDDDVVKAWYQKPHPELSAQFKKDQRALRDFVYETQDKAEDIGENESEINDVLAVDLPKCAEADLIVSRAIDAALLAEAERPRMEKLAYERKLDNFHAAIVTVVNKLAESNCDTYAKFACAYPDIEKVIRPMIPNSVFESGNFANSYIAYKGADVIDNSNLPDVSGMKEGMEMLKQEQNAAKEAQSQHTPIFEAEGSAWNAGNPHVKSLDMTRIADELDEAKKENEALMLIRLHKTDPVLKNAKMGDIAKYYNAIYKKSPTLATNEVALTHALRTVHQSGGILTSQDVLTLAKIEGEKNRNKKRDDIDEE